MGIWPDMYITADLIGALIRPLSSPRGDLCGPSLSEILADPSAGYLGEVSRLKENKESRFTQVRALSMEVIPYSCSMFIVRGVFKVPGIAPRDCIVVLCRVAWPWLI